MCDHVDPVLAYLIKKSKQTDWVKKLILFGSRVRGDFHERSDYDIAVVTQKNNQWAKWALDIKENVPTLCGLDLIELNEQTSESLKKVISQEGEVFYEQ